MADPQHPRQLQRGVQAPDSRAPQRRQAGFEIMSEYDLGRSTVRRWITRINGTGSSKAADNRTPEQQRLLELERENKRLRMEVDDKLNRRPRKRLGYRTSYGARCSETLHLI